MVSAKRKGGGKHPSHDTRFSMSSLYDEVCVNCGATDLTGGGWGKLAEPCPKAKKKEEKMEEKPTPKKGEVYAYKGQRYLVREVSQKNMIQFKDHWHPNVIYTLYPVTDLVFNRALPDFLAKFEKSEGVKKDAGKNPDMVEAHDLLVDLLPWFETLAYAVKLISPAAAEPATKMADRIKVAISKTVV